VAQKPAHGGTVVEPALGDSHDAIARELQARIARPIALERLARAVKCVPVQLDNEPRRLP